MSRWTSTLNVLKLSRCFQQLPPGVEKAFAIQAGREVRIIVKPEQVDDLAAMQLARDSKKKRRAVSYPGQIKVTVMREVRAVDYANKL